MWPRGPQAVLSASDHTVNHSSVSTLACSIHTSTHLTIERLQAHCIHTSKISRMRSARHCRITGALCASLALHHHPAAALRRRFHPISTLPRSAPLSVDHSIGPALHMQQVHMSLPASRGRQGVAVLHCTLMNKPHDMTCRGGPDPGACFHMTDLSEVWA